MYGTLTALELRAEQGEHLEGAHPLYAHRIADGRDLHLARRVVEQLLLRHDGRRMDLAGCNEPRICPREERRHMLGCIVLLDDPGRDAGARRLYLWRADI